ncbi:hypothetical protein [Breoghania sp.]|uniref:glycosyl hydrolase 2 galactose-binding domain-containing protein n=1 Tax=Breoghania sp. TaxID=2065378 RepID=UPI002631114C|nr:hypothetical protein [Breoghania sp.]MDJ0930977.1 hypothetical protein [Breoghania sp.]
MPAHVPGTVASPFEAAGRYSIEIPTPLYDKDAWYLTNVELSGPGSRILVLEGLATIAEVYWNGEKVLSSESMFLVHDIEVDAHATNVLAICFRALAPRLEARGPRARWRPQLTSSEGLRLIRTTLLGHMPGLVRRDSRGRPMVADFAGEEKRGRSCCHKACDTP